jgi:hypothetical protein
MWSLKVRALSMALTRSDRVWIGNWICWTHIIATTSKHNSSWIHTVYNSLWHALNIFNQLYLYQSSGNGFQRWTMVDVRRPLGFRTLPCFSRSSSQRMNLHALMKKAVSSQTELKWTQVNWTNKSFQLAPSWCGPSENPVHRSCTAVRVTCWLARAVVLLLA